MGIEAVRVRGEVVQGHRVASGAANDPRFPCGTIAPQLGFFRAHIPGFDAFLGAPPFAGTINIAFAGAVVQPGAPEFAIGPIRWTEAFPPERFLISRCAIEHSGTRYPAYLYIPDPLAKPDHHQSGNVVEVLAHEIPGIAYGATVWLLHSPASLTITGFDAAALRDTP